MAVEHTDAIAELRQLARAVVGRFEPILREAVDTNVEKTGAGCTGCPLCTLVTVLRGENNDLLDRLSEEIAPVLELIMDFGSDAESAGEPEGTGEPEGVEAPAPEKTPAFEPIGIRISR